MRIGPEGTLAIGARGVGVGKLSSKIDGGEKGNYSVRRKTNKRRTQTNGRFEGERESEMKGRLMTTEK